MGFLPLPTGDRGGHGAEPLRPAGGHLRQQRLILGRIRLTLSRDLAKDGLAAGGKGRGAASRPVAEDGIGRACKAEWGRRREPAVDGRCPRHGGVGLATFAKGDQCDGLADKRVGLIARDRGGAAVGIDGTTKLCGVAVRDAEMAVTDGHLPGRAEPRRGIAASRRGGDHGRVAAGTQVADRRRHLLGLRKCGACRCQRRHRR